MGRHKKLTADEEIAKLEAELAARKDKRMNAALYQQRAQETVEPILTAAATVRQDRAELDKEYEQRRDALVARAGELHKQLRAVIKQMTGDGVPVPDDFPRGIKQNGEIREAEETEAPEGEEIAVAAH